MRIDPDQKLESDDALEWQAFLYASGELDENELVDFERRLENEISVQDALVRAVELIEATASLEQEVGTKPQPASQARIFAGSGHGSQADNAGSKRSRWFGWSAVAVLLLVVTGLVMWPKMTGNGTPKRADNPTNENKEEGPEIAADSLKFLANTWAAILDQAESTELALGLIIDEFEPGEIELGLADEFDSLSTEMDWIDSAGSELIFEEDEDGHDKGSMLF